MSETKKDLMVVDGVKLEVGKSYWVQYKHCKSPWIKVSITRTTSDGIPWQEGDGVSGIIYNGNYNVQELTSEVELEQYARGWLKANLSSNIDTPLPILFSKMYNDYKPNNK